MLGDRLQLYEIHSATLESKVLENTDVLRELQRLRSSGLVIGLTVTGPNQADVIRRALRVSVDGVNPFQVVQATWNLLERSAGVALAEAKASGWGVIIKESLANGRLADRADGEHLIALTKETATRGATIDVLAIAAALSQPWADVVLSGAVTLEQLESNLKSIALCGTGRLARHRRITGGLLGSPQRASLAVRTPTTDFRSRLAPPDRETGLRRHLKE